MSITTSINNNLSESEIAPTLPRRKNVLLGILRNSFFYDKYNEWSIV